MDTIEFKGVKYPAFQATGNAARFALPFAQEFCKGHGLDVGYNRVEWKFPGAIGVDPAINPEFDAMNLPSNENNIELEDWQWNYIFSSHCLEHLNDWVNVLNYWQTMIKRGGTLFLYLPHYSQEYWRPWHNRKHCNILTPEMLTDYFKATGWALSFVSGPDLNNSFYAVAEK